MYQKKYFKYKKKFLQYKAKFDLQKNGFKIFDPNVVLTPFTTSHGEIGELYNLTINEEQFIVKFDKKDLVTKKLYEIPGIPEENIDERLEKMLRIKECENVLQIKGIIKPEEKNWGIVMEYINGITLGDYISTIYVQKKEINRKTKINIFNYTLDVWNYYSQYINESINRGNISKGNFKIRTISDLLASLEVETPLKSRLNNIPLNSSYKCISFIKEIVISMKCFSEKNLSFWDTHEYNFMIKYDDSSSVIIDIDNIYDGPQPTIECTDLKEFYTRGSILKAYTILCKLSFDSFNIDFFELGNINPIDRKQHRYYQILYNLALKNIEDIRDSKIPDSKIPELFLNHILEIVNNNFKDISWESMIVFIDKLLKHCTHEPLIPEKNFEALIVRSIICRYKTMYEKDIEILQTYYDKINNIEVASEFSKLREDYKLNEISFVEDSSFLSFDKFKF
jgi:hypothetical protein